ncbi:acyl-CoA thioesterase [Francisella philomiragia]|uniref:Thioesterase superfamily protein n=1 Tax=Francisella philomiragia subsp. philomiragia (strain ATCC 25017 / CCUG 19701 / FSC 153 / O\|nr:acyl-CoA thioesterase [Francisella philomiragia]AJI47090.1 thioesterase superfamily protein [Francisella philomiragia]AJI48452.1 acyl-ACP thioesterase family protein [Francisella philomiragia]MBK2021199.1 acyl-CoA thioesterase [Francisella philomiragia]MBK2030747.1 acyl-CoA thioesterase [Francisella philomiragia]MBK2263234.1 acyl-CoA thioesterase [Francisella philomiragia]
MNQQLKYFVLSTKVLPEHIDPNNHLNNIVYLQWMQDVAIEHVKANKVFDLTESQGLTWFAKKHTIEYLSQGFLDDDIAVVTWVESITKISTFRKYHIYRKSDKALLCKADTLWLMINAQKGRPAKIPTELVKIFDKYNDFEIDNIESLI